MNLPEAVQPRPARSAALDNLRSFITLLVIAHHVAMGYFSEAPSSPGAFDGWIVWGAFPIIDTAKGQGLGLLLLWNDHFFMALMFLLSGLFVGPSLERKGVRRFVVERWRRIGLTFLIGAGLLAPLAYYPAYLQRASATDANGFGDAWLKLGSWPAGPAWFLWVLLAFGLIAAVVFKTAPQVYGKLGALGRWCRLRPLRGYGVLVAAALVTYVPVTLMVDASHWFSWGPFFAQTSRVLFYGTYFVFGIAIGQRGGLAKDLAAPDGHLARHWMAWLVAATLVFSVFVTAQVLAMAVAAKGEPWPMWHPATNVLMVISGATTSLALLAYFALKHSGSSRIWSSLSQNAFGMYVIHYAVVTWMQYGLLPVALPGLLKAMVVFVGATAVSWGLASVLRRMGGLKHVL